MGTKASSEIKRNPWVLPVLAAFAVACAGLWLLTFSAIPDGTLARIEREGVIRIGYAVEAPYVFLDARGEPTGVEIEVARKITALLGIPHIEWWQVDFGTLIPGLEAGRFDAVAAGMFITPERAKRVSFSEPTLHVGPALLVRAGNPHDLHAYEDISRKPGIKVAVLHGAVEETIIRQIGVPDARISVVPDALTGRIAVESGLVDGLALSAPTTRLMARQRELGSTEIAEPFTAPKGGGGLIGYTAIVFRKADDDLRAAWNRHLRTFIGGPEHRRLIAGFGLSDEELPGTTTTAEILASGVK